MLVSVLLVSSIIKLTVVEVTTVLLGAMAKSVVVIVYANEPPFKEVVGITLLCAVMSDVMTVSVLLVSCITELTVTAVLLEAMAEIVVIIVSVDVLMVVAGDDGMFEVITPVSVDVGSIVV